MISDWIGSVESWKRSLQEMLRELGNQVWQDGVGVGSSIWLIPQQTVSSKRSLGNQFLILCWGESYLIGDAYQVR